MGFSFYGDQSLVGYRLVDGTSIFYPVSPFHHRPPDSRRLERSLRVSIVIQYEVMFSSNFYA